MSRYNNYGVPKKHRKLKIVGKIFIVGLLLYVVSVVAWKSGFLSEEINQKFEATAVFISNTINTIMNMSITEILDAVTTYLWQLWITIAEGVQPDIQPVSSQNTTGIELLILYYTNIERTTVGLDELVWDEELATIAREHSEDMGVNDFFSHDNLRGEGPTERARRHDYPLHKELGGGWYSEGIGENIGKMPTGNVVGVGRVGNDADAIARAEVLSWMASEGHRENILNERYDKIGVGVYFDGVYYICTQDFW